MAIGAGYYLIMTINQKNIYNGDKLSRISGSFASYPWDMKIGFTYVKGFYVTFTHAYVAYVKHATVFIGKHYFHMSTSNGFKWVWIFWTFLTNFSKSMKF